MAAGIRQRALTGFHRRVVAWSRWRIGGRLARMPVLLLTTTGRRSGRRRTIPLTYFEDGRDMILIASNGGAPQHPDWYLNLAAAPAVEVELAGRRAQARAETVVDEAERERLWHQVVSVYPGYAGYQRKTRRQIPVVRLHETPV